MSPGRARSALFVPATRPERIPKALASGTDAVIVDLEDAVAPDAKQAARDALALYMAENPGVRIWVRVNGPDSDQFAEDLALCTGRDGIAGLVIPKCEQAPDLEKVTNKVAKPLWPLIESARGLAALAEIARVEGVERLAFGALDLALDLDLVQDHEGAESMLDQARYGLIIQSRLAGLAPPLAGICPSIRDTDKVAAAAERARAMGFGGMLCIHPAQILSVHRAFTPTATQLEWARRVMEALHSGAGATEVDGQMVDAPVVERARRILALSDSTNRPP